MKFDFLFGFQILTIEDDKVFDLKFTRYTKPKAKYSEAPRLSTVDSSIRLRIGRMQSILLYRFVTEASVSTLYYAPHTHHFFIK